MIIFNVILYMNIPLLFKQFYSIINWIMKNLMILLFAVVLIIGCKANQNKPDCDSWRDRLVDLVQQGSLKSDTIKFQRALALSDSVLSVDTTTDNRRFCYYNRSIILNSLGRTEEGWKNKELEMLTLPENNLERLLLWQ